MSRRCLCPGLMIVALVSACGGSSSTDNGTQPPPPVEIANNPQVWSIDAGEVLLGGLSGFHPTKTVRVGDVLRTYFVRSADGVVVFAQSTDGKNLSNITATNVQRVSTAGDLRTGLDHPSVMQRADGKFLMVYDYSTDPSTQFARRLVALTSNDGITFGNGVLIPASAIDNSPGTGLPFEGVTGLVPMADGSIRAYYTSSGGRIGSAKTTDGGATWTEDPGYRLTGTFANQNFIDVAAIKDTDGAILLYVGYGDFGCFNGPGTATGCVPLRMARSTDGLNFTMYAGNILTPPAGVTQYADPDVFIAADGKWRMLFGDVPGNGSNKLRMAERQ
jgi:hypothetical protein